MYVQRYMYSGRAHACLKRSIRMPVVVGTQEV